MNLKICERMRSYLSVKQFLIKIFEQRDLLYKTKNEAAGNEGTFAKTSHTFDSFSDVCGNLQSRTYATKSFAFSALLEIQERYFLSTRKDIDLLSASTHNYLTCLFCYEVNWLFRSVLLNSLYDVHTVFKKNTWANLGRDFPPVQTGPGAHPTSCKMGTGSSPEVKCGRSVLLTTHPLLLPPSWKSRAIPLPTFWATQGL